MHSLEIDEKAATLVYVLHRSCRFFIYLATLTWLEQIEIDYLKVSICIVVIVAWSVYTIMVLDDQPKLMLAKGDQANATNTRFLTGPFSH